MKEIEFYIRNFDFLNNIDTVDLSFVPSIERRRLSLMDKVTVYMLNKMYTKDAENIVYSSYYGEYERLCKIINQYKEEREVSPNLFSGSVHNYPLSFFLLNKNKSIPYTALSSKENISSGLLAALISKYNNIMFCYSDLSDNQYVSFGLNISKIHFEKSSKFKIIIEKTNTSEPSIKDYINIFNGKINTLKTPYFKLERDE